MALKKRVQEDGNLDRLIPNFSSLSREDKLSLISSLISELKKVEDGIEARAKEFSIPIGIFDNDKLSSLEAIVKYLKEVHNARFSKIAKLINRSSKTIWATYDKASKKMSAPFEPVSTKILIPLSVFANREYSILESLVGFIKDMDYSNHEIGMMLHLDDRTIWTVYDRVKKKRGPKN